MKHKYKTGSRYRRQVKSTILEYMQRTPNGLCDDDRFTALTCIDIDLPMLLEEFQRKQSRLQVKHRLEYIIEYCKGVKVKNAARLGRPRGLANGGGR